MGDGPPGTAGDTDHSTRPESRGENYLLAPLYDPSRSYAALRNAKKFRCATRSSLGGASSRPSIEEGANRCIDASREHGKNDDESKEC